MNHTPSPWIFGAEIGTDSTRIETAEGKIIGAIRTREIARWEKSSPVYEWSDEGHANARLIAAAPDLLKSLETLVNHVGHYASMPHAHSDAHKDVANAYAVIKKATYQ